MLLKTHLAFAVLIILFFIKYINNKIIFVLLVLLATLLPDLDNGFSSFGRSFFSPIHFFAKHRGMIHSITFAVFFSILLAIFFPILSFGFFMGYSVHIVCDSFTKDGVQPFWPLRKRTSGIIKTGGRIEESLFIFLIIIDVVLFFIIFVFGK